MKHAFGIYNVYVLFVLQHEKALTRYATPKGNIHICMEVESIPNL